MKVYLDNCCLQRPLDDRSQVRVQLESEAILAILALCDAQQVNLVSSDVLIFEIDKNPHPQRQTYARETLANAETFVAVDSLVTQRAKALERIGFKGADALHLACAEAAQVDYFCSCDDRLIRRAKTVQSLRIKVVSPLELAGEIVK